MLLGEVLHVASQGCGAQWRSRLETCTQRPAPAHKEMALLRQIVLEATNCCLGGLASRLVSFCGLDG